jgi:hypothetical protein
LEIKVLNEYNNIIAIIHRVAITDAQKNNLKYFPNHSESPVGRDAILELSSQSSRNTLLSIDDDHSEISSSHIPLKLGVSIF